MCATTRLRPCSIIRAPGALTYRVYGPLQLAGQRAFVLSVWEVLAPGAPPRLVTAYPRRRGRR